MSFDLAKTIKLIQGGLLDHSNTWSEYLSGNPGWKDTLIALTGPLLGANVILSLIFSRLSGGYMTYGYGSNFFFALFTGLIFAAIGLLVAVFAFNILAGVFNGKPDFNRAFAAVSLAAIPAWVAGIVGSLIPGVGVLITLAGGIVSLVFMYQIMPLALDVPNDKRVVHFVVSLVAIIIVNMIIGAVTGQHSARQSADFGEARVDPATSTTSSSGIVGEMERQAQLMEAAQADVYDPPEDGMLEEEQVEKYASVMRKTRAAHQQYAERMEKMAEEMKEKEETGESPSITDLGKMYSGIGTAMSANNAEMEIVKTGGGNWAEHQWIKQQLRVAVLQQGEGSDELEHNYALFEKYKDEIEEE